MSIRTFQLLRIGMLILTVLVALPRFNMNDVGVVSGMTGDGAVYNNQGTRTSTSYSPDVQQYTSYVQYFRGQSPTTPLAAPFSTRPLIPLLASFLPFDELTSLDVVNLCFLLCGCVLLDQLLATLRYSPRQRLMGMFMFAVSFPVFYYGATGRIDSAGIALSIALILFYVRGQFAACYMTALIAGTAKETVIVTVFAIAVVIVRSSAERRFIKAAIIVLCFIISTVLMRQLAPGTAARVWSPNTTDLMTNLLRPRAYASSLLAFGIPGVIAVWRSIRRPINTRDEFTQLLLLGTIGCFGVWVYSMFSAYTDGRFVWIAYPFLIPYALQLFSSSQSDDSARQA